MRVLLDTNVLLSYLLSPATPRVITSVVTACLTLDGIELLVPPEQLEEFAGKVASKRYFRTRIPQHAIGDFVARLEAFSALLPSPRRSCLQP